MKDLIKEIEEIIVSLKRQYKNCFEEIDCPLFTSDEIRGKILAYKDCLNLLNQHNIITAPKQIKLSEVVERLEQHFHKTKFYLYDNKTIGFDYIDYDGCEEFAYLIGLNDNMTIKHIDYDLNENDFKWLYTLWIANVEIIDDLEELNNVKD